jgi:hypothetical protein
MDELIQPFNTLFKSSAPTEFRKARNRPVKNQSAQTVMAAVRRCRACDFSLENNPVNARLFVLDRHTEKDEMLSLPNMSGFSGGKLEKGVHFAN